MKPLFAFVPMRCIPLPRESLSTNPFAPGLTSSPSVETLAPNIELPELLDCCQMSQYVSPKKAVLTRCAPNVGSEVTTIPGWVDEPSSSLPDGDTRLAEMVGPLADWARLSR